MYIKRRSDGVSLQFGLVSGAENGVTMTGYNSRGKPIKIFRQGRMRACTKTIPWTAFTRNCVTPFRRDLEHFAATKAGQTLTLAVAE
jgi:hypothetical protein